MGSFVITLREGFEAALVIGLVLAYLSKSGQQRHGRSVWLGVGVGVLLSATLGAILFLSAGRLEGSSEKAYEGTAMIVAACVVTWMAFWMRRQAATIGGHLRQQVSDSLRRGGGLALASVALVGVSREGIETALFLFASTGESGAAVTWIGAGAGMATAAVLGVLFYRGALRLDVGRFFLITSVLVIGFAAYLIFGGLHEFGELTGNGAFEVLAPLAAALYGGGFAVLYWRDSRRPAAQPAGELATETA
jgi:high-affinity iron transporter